MEKEPLPSYFSFFVNKIIEKSCLRVILWGTFLVLFTPLIISGKFFFPFVGPKSLYFMALVEIIFAAYLLLAISSPKYRPKFNILLIAIILFIAISILSTVFGASPGESFWSKYERMGGLLMWFHLFAFFVATSSVFKKRDWLRVFEISVMVAVLVSILALLTDRGMGPLVSAGFQTRQGATLGNSSFLAAYLLFNVFLALYLFLIKIKKETKIFFGLSFAFLALALSLSTGRAAILAFVAGLILLFFLKLIFCEKGRLRLAGILLLIIFSVGGMSIIFSYLKAEEDIIQRVMTERFSVGIGKDRLLVWGIGLKGWQEKPWLGWGPENFNLVFTKHFEPCIFLPDYGADIWYDRAHNIIVDTLVATGILGFLSYLGIFASVLYILWKRHLSQKIEFITAGLFSVILFSYFLQNLTVFDMVSSFMMFFLILGFAGSVVSKRDIESVNPEEEKAFSFKPWIIPVILILFILSFFYFVVQPLRSNAYLIRAFRTPNLTERISLYKKSLEISSLGKHQARETIANREIGKYSQREVAESIPLEIQKQELDFLSEELEKSIKESPLLFSSYLALGKVYNAYGRIDPSKLTRAGEVLEKAIEVSPGNQQGYWILTQTNLFQGKFDEAILSAKKAVELEPRVEKSSLMLIEVAAIIRGITGNDDLLEREVEAALEIDPSWATNIQMILERRQP